MIRHIFFILFVLWIGAASTSPVARDITVETHLIPVAIEDRSFNVKGPVKPQTGIKFPSAKSSKQSKPLFRSDATIKAFKKPEKPSDK